MKTLFVLAIGAVGLFTAPALAGNSKLRVAAKSSTKAKPAVTAAPVVAATSAELPLPDLLVLPELPADTSSPLVPFPELEHARPLAPIKPAKQSKPKAPAMKFGDDYVLGGRESVKPGRDVEQIVPKNLSQAQVGAVVQSHIDEIQVCWNAVPKAQRADACSAYLSLSISDTGAVTDIELGGNVPESAHKCITSAVSRWTFPVAETRSDVEYGISLRSL